MKIVTSSYAEGYGNDYNLGEQGPADSWAQPASSMGQRSQPSACVTLWLNYLTAELARP